MFRSLFVMCLAGLTYAAKDLEKVTHKVFFGNIIL